MIVVVGCAPQAPPDTPELRMEKARAIAMMEVDDGGPYQETLDLGASLATDATTDALTLELGRELADEESLEVRALMRAGIAEVLTAERWTAAAAEIYAANLTAAELGAVLEFYGSPAGSKVLGIQTALDDQMGTAIEEIIEADLDAFSARVDSGLAGIFPELAEELE